MARINNLFQLSGNTNGRRRGALIGIAVGAAAVLAGISLAAVGPIYTAIIAAVLAGGFWVISRLENAITAMILVVVILPYATLPFKIVLTPSFLDITMGVVIILYLFQWMNGERRTFTTTPVHIFILLLMAVTVFSFVAGLRYAGLTSNRLRQVAELMVCMSFGMILVDLIDSNDKLESIMRVLMLAGALAAVVGIILWILPNTLTNSILGRLAIIGYPGGDVIHNIEDNPELAERAIGTAVDPNSFGGVLVVLASLTTGQLVASKPILGSRWLTSIILILMVSCLALTFSRGAMLAYVVAAAFIAVMTDRRLIVAMIVVIAVIAILPFSQEYVERFLSGVQGSDLATQMRFGEYKDAFILLSRYPLLGVGFSGAPDIDIYLGVANLYLTIASNMGLLGLASFLGLVGYLLYYASTARTAMDKGTTLRATWLGLMGAIIAVLVSGIFDHYFFNLEFFHASTILWILIGLLIATAKLGLDQLRSNPGDLNSTRDQMNRSPEVPV